MAEAAPRACHAVRGERDDGLRSGTALVTRTGTGLSAEDAPSPAADVGVLYLRHRARIHALCLHRLGDREDAADAVQETFMKTWIALRAGHRIDRPLPWLLTVARNVCIDRQRALGTRPNLTPLF